MNALTKMNEVIQMMTSREIAELTGKNHADVMRDIRNMVEQLTKAEMLSCANSTTYIGKDGRQYPQYELDKDTCLTLLLGYDAVARMKVVKRWQQLEAMPTSHTPPQNLLKDQVDAGILLLRSAAEDLKLPPSAVLGGYKRLEAQVGVVGMLPNYAVDAPTSSTTGSSEETLAATDLLKIHKVQMSTAAFNKLLVSAGMLEMRERPSSKGGTKKFAMCSNLEYGKNVSTPNNPKSLQPHWYVSKFKELLALVLPRDLGLEGM